METHFRRQFLAALFRGVMVRDGWRGKLRQPSALTLRPSERPSPHITNLVNAGTTRAARIHQSKN